MAKETDSLLVGNKADGPVPQFLDPQYWNPKCHNWEIIDWEKWDSLIQKPPEIYDPPQYKAYEGSRFTSGLNWFSHRSPFLKSCCMPQCMRSCCISNKMTTSRISDAGDFLKEFLDPNMRSASVPDLLKGAWWMRDNQLAPETLMTFEHYAWKSKPFGSGPLGLGSQQYRWTFDDTTFGMLYAKITQDAYVLVQIHPEGKWINLALFFDPYDETATVDYLWAYVVQEGDVFKKPNGEVLKLNPGDLMRMTFDKKNPYSVSMEECDYQYTPVRVATLSEDGTLNKIQPHFDEMQTKATQTYGKQPMCCGLASCCMSPDEMVEMQLNNLSNTQLWVSPPKPPTAQTIDHL